MFSINFQSCSSDGDILLFKYQGAGLYTADVILSGVKSIRKWPSSVLERS